ncbi:DegT/DnrJ/EryC1/StrS family aminotransferase [Photobacterium gaetbulicola]|uniref:Putative DegT/DnrJ/EryC1/StrS aminotransferase n=1 Tax=Photobacterium gaetbulicola Gung47 TaxID=658445 RepID=A0A0C5WK51_9GAMM|nr:DegT/DnrJ/EryC1/StrS family aminotransferase [Photobacterium gaetbulicola]AJR05494.1 putative DegT/DnrJ/EryC1/StrS aminotransferase [Photobacterium gaetbulicola Gung47]PST99765.1 DegT/DnrJ/EryC1/StrS family aminotransferase [Photobacterium gaetbulicola]
MIDYRFSSNDFPSWPVWDNSEESALANALQSGFWAGSRAENIKLFPERFSSYQNADYGIALANGTVTLESALIALGIGEGDEVIVPAITFVATASAVLRVNAVPVIVDVDEDTYCICPKKVDEAITPKTKAIIAVHVAGTMCDMDSLLQISRTRKLALIEDCAHAHGSRWKGRGAGSLGELGSFSFQHSKLMSSGEGGALISNHKELLNKAWDYANCGREGVKGTYHHPIVGTNARITEWQAAILNSQLERYPEQFEKRLQAASFLDKRLAGIKGVKPQKNAEGSEQRAYYCYIFELDLDLLGEEARQHMFEVLSQAKVPLSLAYPSLNDLDVFKNTAFEPTIRREIDASRFETPIAQKVSAQTIWLHHAALLADEEVLEKLVLLIEKAVSTLRGNS